MSNVGEDNVVHVTLVLSPTAAGALRGHALESEDSRDVLAAAEELGIQLLPLHAEGDDPSLATYFEAEAADPHRAEQIIERLLRCRAVEGAYVKPPGEPPD